MYLGHGSGQISCKIQSKSMRASYCRRNARGVSLELQTVAALLGFHDHGFAFQAKGHGKTKLATDSIEPDIVTVLLVQ